MRLSATLQNIPRGKAGIIHTLELMRRLVREGKKKLPIRQTALFIVQDLPQKDFFGEINELFLFIRDSIRYVKDVNGVETIQYPEITLQIKQGDCDDKSVLLAALLESIGHKTRFKAVGFSPDKFSHVYVEAFLNGKWIALDPTMNNQLGWSPENIYSEINYNI